MTVDVTWIRCLDKRDHVIPEGAEVLIAGHLKAVCDAHVYPLRVGTVGTCRRCRGCKDALSTAPESLSLPQRTRGKVLRQLIRRFMEGIM